MTRKPTAPRVKPAAAKTSPAPASALGPRLRAIRLRRGLSLRELARRLELSPSSISQIETGKMQPSVRTLYAFVAEFGVTMDEVLFDQDPLPDGSAVDSVPAVAGPGLAVQRADGRPTITLSNEGSETVRAVWVVRGRRGPHPGHETS
jgi:transcriptional regulator with XRE-family HTH domain